MYLFTASRHVNRCAHAQQLQHCFPIYLYINSTIFTIYIYIYIYIAGVFAEARSDKSTSCHKSISTPTSDSNDRSFLNYSLSPGDSTMLSLAPTEGLS